jgi:hypothetical protein
MNPQPTPEQRREFENALKIGEILASTVETVDSPRIRVNPHAEGSRGDIYHVGREEAISTGQRAVRNELFVV